MRGRWILNWCWLFIALVGAWFGSEVYHARMSDPRGKASTYAEYRARMAAPVRYEVYEREGRSFYAAYGRVRAPLALVSGPPVYVFDEAGRMRDWTGDMGDDDAFGNRWKTKVRRAISEADFDRQLGRGVPQPSPSGT